MHIAAHQAYEALYKSCPDAVIIADDGGMVCAVNPAFERMFGYAPAEIEGKPVHVLCDRPEDFIEQGIFCSSSGLPGVGPHDGNEVRYRRKDGSVFQSRTSGEAICDADGMRTGFVGIIRDITPREKLRTLLASVIALAGGAGVTNDEALEEFLRLGTEYFGLESGMVTAIEAGRVIVRHVYDPSGEFRKDQTRELEATFCGTVYDSGEVRSYYHAGNEPVASQRCYREMGLEAYIGAPMRRGGATIGTLGFFGYQEKAQPFQEEEETLVRFMADWLSGFIGQREQQAELRRLTRELAFSADKFRHLYRATPAMLHSIDREHRLVEVSDYWLEKMGFSDRNEVIGRPVTDFQIEEERARRTREIDEFWQSGKPVWNRPFRFKRKDGTHFEVEISAIVADAGTVAGDQSMAVIFDVSERNEAQRQLEAQNRALEAMSLEVRQIADRFKKFYRETPAMLHSIDEDLRLVEVSDFWLKKMGYADRSEVIGRSILEFHTPDSAATAKHCIDRFWQDSEPVINRAYDFLRKDGTVFESELSAILATPQDAEKKKNLAVIFDVTERNHALRELKRKNSELERLNEELDTFASVASHDLQEPLRKIRKFAEIAQEELSAVASKDGIYALHVLKGAAGRMQKLVSNLLRYSKTVNDVMGRERVNLGSVIEQVIEDLSMPIDDASASVTCGALPAVNADPVQVRQMFQNFIENAIRYRHPERKAEVQISARRHEESGVAVITVSDNGIGFPQDKDLEIYLPFRRLNRPADTDGSGLGLTICNRIADRHGWRLHTIGKPDEGAAFSVIIPSHDLVSE